jgi:hypothetical protein
MLSEEKKSESGEEKKSVSVMRIFNYAHLWNPSIDFLFCGDMCTHKHAECISQSCSYLLNRIIFSASLSLSIDGFI